MNNDFNFERYNGFHSAKSVVKDTQIEPIAKDAQIEPTSVAGRSLDVILSINKTEHNIILGDPSSFTLVATCPFLFRPVRLICNVPYCNMFLLHSVTIGDIEIIPSGGVVDANLCYRSHSFDDDYVHIIQHPNRISCGIRISISASYTGLVPSNYGFGTKYLFAPAFLGTVG